MEKFFFHVRFFKENCDIELGTNTKKNCVKYVLWQEEEEKWKNCIYFHRKNKNIKVLIGIVEHEKLLINFNIK